MKTEVKPITPTEAGLSLVVCSGPRGTVRDNDWPCIEYTLQLEDKRRKVIWTGEYRLGVGHVKPVNFDQMGEAWSSTGKKFAGLSAPEKVFSHHWNRTPSAQWKDKQLWADTAAKLAAIQKVTPKLDDVCHSLLMDGSAFFDGERFEDWAANYGYSADSIKALQTFETCDKIGRDLSRDLSRYELEALREWASNY